jgi:hypothetical protein
MISIEDILGKDAEQSHNETGTVGEEQEYG